MEKYWPSDILSLSFSKPRFWSVMKSPNTENAVQKRVNFIVPNQSKNAHSWYKYLFLIAFYIMYLLLGAYVFQYFEEKHEVSRYHNHPVVFSSGGYLPRCATCFEWKTCRVWRRLLLHFWLESKILSRNPKVYSWSVTNREVEQNGGYRFWILGEAKL